MITACKYRVTQREFTGPFGCMEILASFCTNPEKPSTTPEADHMNGLGRTGPRTLDQRDLEDCGGSRRKAVSGLLVHPMIIADLFVCIDCKLRQDPNDIKESGESQ